MKVTIYDNAPAGLVAQSLPPLLQERFPYLWIVEDMAAAESLQAHLQFFGAPNKSPDKTPGKHMKSLILPAWDCLPYDRISPGSDICARRMAVLAEAKNCHILIAPVNACLQRLPPMELTCAEVLSVQQGKKMPLGDLAATLSAEGYERTDTVRAPAQYSLRGSLLDVFPAAANMPYRIDFFGDEIDKIRSFDPLTQLSEGTVKSLNLSPGKEIILSEESCLRFCRNYRSHFGVRAEADPIFHALKNRIAYPSMEHWLPCFYDSLTSVFDYVKAVIGFENMAAHAKLRLEMIADHYQARQERLQNSGTVEESPYRPLPTDSLYLSAGEWQARLQAVPVVSYHAFAAPQADGSLEGKPVENFADVRNKSDGDLFAALKHRIGKHKDKKVLIACGSPIALERTQNLLQEHKLGDFPEITRYADSADYPKHKGFVCVLPLSRGYVTPELLVYAEADIFGDKETRLRTRKRQRGEDFIREVSALNVGDLAVHEEHGIGRFLGLRALEIESKSHECAELEYAGAAKLFVPVENIEVLSRYGGEDMNHPLDNLGQAAWQARKARVQKRLKDMTEKLVAVAAERALTEMPVLQADAGDYDEFASAFPFVETEDQLAAIDDVIADLASGKPMDRLICGDTGFGKTEVALRAGFINAYKGGQTAVIAPTTLLARQHYLNFSERFKPFGVEVKMLSRLTSARDKKTIRQAVKDGAVDIVIGTHALLQKSVEFKNLTLAIIDEEQHFGVKQKQKLKDSTAGEAQEKGAEEKGAEGKAPHILTLTATPIPRTMQMAVHGIQDMSIIATPPIDRLAVHTFTLPYDSVTVRDAILRERMRGGQFFAVVPRISDLRMVAAQLKATVEDLSLMEAHGQMTGERLEKIMTAFINGEIEGLLSTHIIESGIDIPNANTMFIFRPEMFSLAQLYQLRGRIGRSNRRGYCYMISAADKILTKGAQKRLEIMQTLDSVGAGFTLASYDLDIRGAGNLLGEEQSGHIREVGVELFQKLLKQAVREARARLEKRDAERQAEELAAEIAEDFSPLLNLGVKVIIPEAYIPDLNLRLNFYQRLARFDDVAAVPTLAAEMQDRFGALPEELDLLFAVSVIKIYCKQAGIAKVNAGARGAVLYFHKNRFANVEGLAEFMHKNAATVKLQPDHSLSLTRRWAETESRLTGLKAVTEELAEIAGEAPST